MSIVKYAIIDANGKVEACYDAPEPPVLDNPSLSFIINTAGADCGWSYIDGQFIAPPPPQYIPLPLPTIESIHEQMLQLQAQLAMITASASATPEK